jgi:thiol-disulfide isomerase/thioredoxin
MAPRFTRIQVLAVVAALAAVPAVGLLAAAPTGAVDVGRPAPDFKGEVWLNSEPLTLQSERGKAVLVYFWTFGCHNCKAVQPHVKGWYERYRDDGLQVVAVHAPEFSFERDVDNVKAYVAEQGLAYPVVIDNDFAIWRRYANRYWPVVYLIDRNGRLRYRHIGEGRYEETRRWIERVLKEPAAG